MLDNIDPIVTNLIDKINELPNIKRLHELEEYIDSNSEISEIFKEIKKIQKKIVNSRYYNKINQALLFEKEREELIKKISDIPFVDEYLDLLEEAYYMLKNISNILSYEINKDIK